MDRAAAELLEHGVFLPVFLYRTIPVTLPFVVRDLSCRGGNNGPRGDRDAWGSPDSRGYMRDDNTMVKGLIRSMAVSRTGQRLGAGFTAAHVWRVVDHVDLASKIPLLYSFVPNVVWLPRDLARFTDIEGGPYQRALQAISWSIYRHVEVLGPTRAITEEAWAYIATPAHHVPVEPAGVAWFVPNPRTAHALVGRVDKVIQALVDIEAGNSLPRRVVCSRYATGLPSVDAEARRDLLGHLRRFVPTM